MKILCSFPPVYCPGCGEHLRGDNSTPTAYLQHHKYFFAGNAFMCVFCNSEWQYLPKEVIDDMSAKYKAKALETT
jgi:hypothetical protein